MLDTTYYRNTPRGDARSPHCTVHLSLGGDLYKLTPKPPHLPTPSNVPSYRGVGRGWGITAHAADAAAATRRVPTHLTPPPNHPFSVYFASVSYNHNSMRHFLQSVPSLSDQFKPLLNVPHFRASKSKEKKVRIMKVNSRSACVPALVKTRHRKPNLKRAKPIKPPRRMN